MGQFGIERESEIREALIPLLENNNEKVLREVIIWLGNVDGRFAISPDSKLVFYRKTLLEMKDSPPAGLVNYVFGNSPGQALLLFGEIYSEKPKFGNYPRDLMWADHVIMTVRWRIRNRFLQEGDLEKAQKELDTLTKHKGWYARRYVVEIINESPKLASPGMVNRLQKDPNPLVSEPAKLIK